MIPIRIPEDPQHASGDCTCSGKLMAIKTENETSCISSCLHVVCINQWIWVLWSVTILAQVLWLSATALGSFPLRRWPMGSFPLVQLSATAMGWPMAGKRQKTHDDRCHDLISLGKSSFVSKSGIEQLLSEVKKNELSYTFDRRSQYRARKHVCRDPLWEKPFGNTCLSGLATDEQWSAVIWLMIGNS